LEVHLSLFNNEKQKELFQLQYPHKASTEDCAPIKGIFENFHCKDSYVLSQRSLEYNCIGWSIGVKKFIDPTTEINPYYSSKSEIGTVTYTLRGKTSTTSIYQYMEQSESCKIAVTDFFNKFKEESVIPQKNTYIAADSITDPPPDDTIAFYFKAGDEDATSSKIERKGFQHAARYTEELNEWVSDVWSSKLGQYKLMTHKHY
jgi:hypothetical protein